MANEPATLYWDVSGASTVTIEPDVGDVVLSGDDWVSPQVDTTYVLTASNEYGNVTATTEVIGYDGPWTGTLVDPTPQSELPRPSELDPIEPDEPSLEPIDEPALIEPATPTLRSTDEPAVLEPGPPTPTPTLSLTSTPTATPTITPSPLKKAKPDLVITDIWRSGSTFWYYMVKNQGDVECGGSSSELMIDGEPRLLQNIGPLASGESREAHFSYKYACEAGTSFIWSVAADVKSAVAESDENNNSLTEKFTCSK
jgi:hypothetical protein